MCVYTYVYIYIYIYIHTHIRVLVLSPNLQGADIPVDAAAPGSLIIMIIIIILITMIIVIITTTATNDNHTNNSNDNSNNTNNCNNLSGSPHLMPPPPLPPYLHLFLSIFSFSLLALSPCLPSSLGYLQNLLSLSLSPSLPLHTDGQTS